MTAADYDALEARVAELEHQHRNELMVKLDAANYGVGLLHTDVQRLAETQDIHTAALERVETRLDRHGDLLGQHSDMLAEILRRLPEAPA